MTDSPMQRKLKIKEEHFHHPVSIKDESVDKEEETKLKGYDCYEKEERKRPWYDRKLRRFLKTDLKETDELPPITGSLSRLPEPMIMEILARLPLEILYQNRLVSKFWYFLIRHPHFAKFHLNHSKNTSQYTMFLDKGKWDYYIANHVDDRDRGVILYPARFHHDDEKAVELCSCNGLVFSNVAPFDITNPIIGESVTLTQLPHILRRRAVLTAFGFDQVNNEYKIIRVLAKKSKCSGNDIEILNLTSDKWRLINEVPFTARGKQSAVFFNGAFHWIASMNGDPSRKAVIITFKIDTEEFRILRLPCLTSKMSKNFDHYLVVLGEYLCLVHSVAREIVVIWVMKQYGVPSSWVKEYIIMDLKIDVDRYSIESFSYTWVDEAFFEMHNLCRKPYVPIRLLKNGEIVLLCSHRYLGYYNPKTKAITCDQTWRTECMGYCLHPVAYTASLISPQSIFRNINSDKEAQRFNEGQHVRFH